MFLRSVRVQVVRQVWRPCTRYASTESKVAIDHLRNIGIIAHIDAGKTTTTERMLYYSGLISRIGNVDEGDTVTDYLAEEKDRGITIQSAAVTIPWNNHQINVIDTPGHADFTFEVIRSLRVLDGGVTILDAVAGVEAQTEKVWKQAQQMKIPLIAYVNKMDREGAGYGRTVKEIVGRLGARAVLVNIPYFVEDKSTSRMVFEGVVDVFDKRLLRWEAKASESVGDGKTVTVTEIKDGSDLYTQCLEARKAAVEQLGEFDEAVIDSFLDTEDYMAVPASVLKSALRKATIERWAVPILAGASFRNIGVQPLLEAVVDYLPSPIDVEPPEVVSTMMKRVSKKRKSSDGEDSSILPAKMDPRLGCVINNDKHLTTALAFKVISHPNRGLMTFVRVYSGKLQSSSSVINSTTGEKVKIGKLLVMNGEVPQEVKSLSAGAIGVITGTDEVSTGDTLIAHSTSRSVNKIPPREACAKLLPIEVPPPVFSVSIEPTTVADRRKLESSLQLVLKEDPSLAVGFDEESGQTILSGMGELHLEITKNRLVREMKVNADVGEVRVTFKETIVQPSADVTKKVDATDMPGSFSITLSLDSFEGPVEDTEYYGERGANPLDFDNNIVVFAKNAAPQFVRDALFKKERQAWPLELTYEQMMSALVSGIVGALQAGGRLARLPLHSVCVKVKHWSLPIEATTAATLNQVSRLAVQQALTSLPQSASTILEPVMNVSVYVDDQDLGVVTQDLMSARNARITDIAEQDASNTGEHAAWARRQAEETYVPFDPTLKYAKASQSSGKKVIKAEAPLQYMIGYLPKLRSLTKGRGIYDMEYQGMQRSTPDRVKEILGL